MSTVTMIPTGKLLADQAEQRRQHRKYQRELLAMCQDMHEQRDKITRAIDQAVANHADAVEPIQAALTLITQAQIDGDFSADKRKQALLAELESHNRALEDTMTRCKAARRVIADEIKNRQLVSTEAIQNAIVRNCEPEAADEQWQLQQDTNWANHRIRHGKEKLHAAACGLENAERHGNVQLALTYAPRVKRWKQEIALAEEAMAEAQRRARILREEILAGE